MSMKVLQDNNQIIDARQELLKKGLSSVDTPIQHLMRKFSLLRGVSVGDTLKSWDVLSTISFLEKNVAKTAPILDIGCYSSELILAMLKAGYSNLSGADLNPDVRLMPCQEAIRYENCNFMHTTFDDASFQTITSISVIEHGFDSTALLKEMSRLLRPSGYFIASFDYWPDKVDTTGKQIFGMDWKIFSKTEVDDFISKAGSYGLFPAGDLDFGGKERVIDFEGWKYTFAWLALQKQV